MLFFRSRCIRMLPETQKNLINIIRLIILMRLFYEYYLKFDALKRLFTNSTLFKDYFPTTDKHSSGTLSSIGTPSRSTTSILVPPEESNASSPKRKQKKPGDNQDLEVSFSPVYALYAAKNEKPNSSRRDSLEAVEVPLKGELKPQMLPKSLIRSDAKSGTQKVIKSGCLLVDQSQIPVIPEIPNKDISNQLHFSLYGS